MSQTTLPQPRTRSVPAESTRAGLRGPWVQSAIALCFFLSGGASLVYEVVWARNLALFLGSSGLAHAVILSAFMGGLALGSWVLGKASDLLAYPLRAYSLLELGIGCWGIFYPSLTQAAEWIHYRTAETLGFEGGAGLPLKLLLSAALLLPPTFLMGGTLPLLGKFLSHPGNAARTVSRLYFLNSLGAASGTLLGGFLLIPRFGLRSSTMLLGGLNVAVGAVAVLTALFAEPDEEDREERPLVSPRRNRHQSEILPLGARDRILLAGIGVSGFVAMVYQLGWVRFFTQVLGSSSHSFTLMLAAFITGISLGGLAASRWLDRFRDLRRIFSLTQIGLAATVLLPLAAYERFPYWFWWATRFLTRSEEAYTLHLLTKYFFVFTVMLVPTFFCGVALPVVTAQLARRGRVGAQIGLVYAWNSLGTVLGCLATGFLLLPILGVQWTLKAGVLLNLAVAAATLSRPGGHSARPGRIRRMGLVRRTLLASSGTLALLALILPSWDPRLLAFGVHRSQEEPPRNFPAYRSSLEELKVLFADEGTDARVLVVEAPGGVQSLVVNGKSEASTGTDLHSQMLMGHLPLLLHPDPQDVLLVGLGSGVTAGSVLTHALERPVDCVEPLSGVERAARRFGPWNRGALDDPGLRLASVDAREFLRSSRRQYDVIISETTRLWIAGAGNLFSCEFYRDCASHLRPGGILAQSFRADEMSDELVRILARTFLRSFPHVHVFNAGTARGQFILLGSRTPLRPDSGRLRWLFGAPAVREDLERIGISSPAAILALESHSPRAFARIAGQGPLNTDDLPTFESEAPRAYFAATGSEILTRGDERRGPGEGLLIREHLNRFPPGTEELRALVEVFHGGVAENPPLLVSALREHLARSPEDLDTRCLLAEELLRGDGPRAALEVLDRAGPECRADPKSELKLRRREFEALRRIEEAELTPFLSGPSFPRARRCLERCLEIDPRNHDRYYLALARLAAREGNRSATGRWLSLAESYRRERPALASRETTEGEFEEVRLWITGRIDSVSAPEGKSGKSGFAD